VRPEPFRIEPIFSPRLWGSRSLAPLFPEKSNLPEPLGEAWLTGVDCRVANGPFKGKTLGAAWKEMPVEWRGENLVNTTDFPLLVKFIFPTEKLSIQVHPDDSYASKHEQVAGGRGKTEMWQVVSAEPGATLFAGLKPGVTKKQFVEAMESHKNLEELLQSHEVNVGDTFFIPAGTAHTIGPNMTICEVQEYSDLTYRIYDYDRVDAHGKPRALHVQKALDVLNFDSKDYCKNPRVSLSRTFLAESELLAACPYFAAEIWETRVLGSQTHPSHFDLLVALSGNGVIDGPGFAFPYQQGECWFLPADLGRYYILAAAIFPAGEKRYEQRPNPEPTVLIRTYVPEIHALRDELSRAGHTNSAISKTVFG
jgi:mannose-6-phosphate isomerase